MFRFFKSDSQRVPQKIRLKCQKNLFKDICAEPPKENTDENLIYYSLGGAVIVLIILFIVLVVVIYRRIAAKRANVADLPTPPTPQHKPLALNRERVMGEPKKKATPAKGLARNRTIQFQVKN